MVLRSRWRGRRLQPGDRVGIVGGGPAGSFAAIHLARFAAQAGLSLEILLFEPRDFRQPGPRGCNRCAGIVSSHLVRNLERMGIPIPPEVIRADLRKYTLYLDGETWTIEQPNPDRRIVSVYRGGGPRIRPRRQALASFDAFLLQQAQAHGARHIPQRVRKVYRGPDGRPLIHTAQGDYPVALVVLATGVNSSPPMDAAFGYRPPATAFMAQDEVLLPDHWPTDEVRVFFRRPEGLKFGALIPKGPYLNISLLGKGLSRQAVKEFLAAQGLLSVWDEHAFLCGCTPRIAVSPAKRYYGDGWVAVGDAAVTRLYKDGMGSAFRTARAAMWTAVYHGIDRRAFARGYAPLCRRIARDNLFGRCLFFCWSVTLRLPVLLQAWKACLREEQRRPLEQRVHMRVLWGMFTGDEPYRRLFALAFHPRTVFQLVRHIRWKKEDAP